MKQLWKINEPNTGLLPGRLCFSHPASVGVDLLFKNFVDLLSVFRMHSVNVLNAHCIYEFWLSPFVETSYFNVARAFRKDVSMKDM